ncbi:hypothetical protein ACV35Q_32250, partial [Pseudomonas aeruginosa]
GLFFALGGYAMGMYLMRQASGDSLPAFMTFLSWNELPWYWAGTQHFLWALCLVVLVPGAVIGKPRMLRKSVKPLLPPKPVSLRKNSSMPAKVRAWVMIEK